MTFFMLVGRFSNQCRQAVMALQKGGPGARKVREGHYLVY